MCSFNDIILKFNYYRAIYKRHVDQWNLKEGPEINLCICGQMIFTIYKNQDHSVGKGQPFVKLVLGKPNIHIQKNEAGSLPYTIYKSQLEMDQRPKCMG